MGNMDAKQTCTLAQVESLVQAAVLSISKLSRRLMSDRVNESNKSQECRDATLQLIRHYAQAIPEYMSWLEVTPSASVGQPSRALLEAASNDMAVKKLIKKASRKTPIRGK